MEFAPFLTEQIIPAFNRGLVNSLLLIVPSATMGLVLGILAGMARAFGGPLLSRMASWYAGLFRGTPLVVQLFIWYFGLPNLGIYLSPYWASVMAFSLCSGAYHSEYIRGGLLSIRRGQLLAAQSLGFSTLDTLRSIIIPQAFRHALPGCGNEFIYLIKYSSLAYIITFIELTGEAKILATRHFEFTQVFLVVGLYYLALVSLATWGLHALERRLHIPGFGRA